MSESVADIIRSTNAKIKMKLVDDEDIILEEIKPKEGKDLNDPAVLASIELSGLLL